MTSRRDYTVTVIVEHVDGPEHDAHWEGAVPALLVDVLDDNVHLHVEDGATYRIVRAAVEDCVEVRA